MNCHVIKRLDDCLAIALAHRNFQQDQPLTYTYGVPRAGQVPLHSRPCNTQVFEKPLKLLRRRDSGPVAYLMRFNVNAKVLHDCRAYAMVNETHFKFSLNGHVHTESWCDAQAVVFPDYHALPEC